MARMTQQIYASLESIDIEALNKPSTLLVVVDMIKALNGLDENATIFPNQQLLIPVLHRRPPMGPMRDTQNQYDMYF